MKTKLFNKGLVLLAGVIVLISSCTKNDGLPVQNTGGQNADFMHMGVIIDSGLYKGELRHMRAVFYNQGNVVDPGTGDILGSAVFINVGFNSSTDSEISSGLYNFSQGKEATPYTFDSGFLREVFSSGGSVGNDYKITGGTIELSSLSDIYTVTYDCILDNGQTLKGTFVGSMEYSDAVFKK